MINITEQLLNADNFIDENSWYELLKMEIDDLLSMMKRMSKLTWVSCKPVRLRSMARCLAECRDNLLRATELMPVKPKDSPITESATVTAMNNPIVADSISATVNIVNDPVTSDLQGENTAQVFDTEQTAIACENEDEQVNEIDTNDIVVDNTADNATDIANDSMIDEITDNATDCR